MSKPRDIRMEIYWLRQSLIHSVQRQMNLRFMRAPQCILDNEARLIWRKSWRLRRLTLRLKAFANN